MSKNIIVGFIYIRKGNGGPIEGLEPYEFHTQKEVLSKKEVCHQCKGEGSHVNPNIDGNGLTVQDFDELGSDFKENYMNGSYDITCDLCKGKRVIDVVDLESLSDEDREAYHRNLEEISYQENEAYYERKFCGD